ncbi:hypothetical protein [Flagellimonas ruestringensis]|uniref:hypothetical protein n=1 Tax=Flagellimonas ruestringensis TaxID=111501 RepID=UPI001651ADDE|nr:hypothetical protein [Allomuricauda ruestringensis]
MAFSDVFSGAFSGVFSGAWAQAIGEANTTPAVNPAIDEMAERLVTFFLGKDDFGFMPNIVLGYLICLSISQFLGNLLYFKI